MAEIWPDDKLSVDGFLGGRLRIWQPKHGYRAGVDAVLLAACIPARSGQSVLELGCGVGTAMFCLGARVPGIQLTGLELQADYAALTQRNATENNLVAEVVTGDLLKMPAELKERRFDHVIANPPYFDPANGTASGNRGRDIALRTQVPLSEWVSAASKRLAPKGLASFIHRAERLPDLLRAASGRLGSLEVLPLVPRVGRPARLVLVRGRKGGRADFRIHHGWVLHEGDSHNEDRENYTRATACVLRNGAALDFPA